LLIVIVNILSTLYTQHILMFLKIIIDILQGLYNSIVQVLLVYRHCRL